MAAEALIGTEQMDRSVASSDAEYLLRNLRDGAEIPERSKKAVAYLIRSRLWHPFPDNSVRPAESAVRSHCLSFIVGLLEQQRPELLPGGTLDGGPAGGEKGATAIRVRGTGRVRTIDLTPDVALFRLAGEKSLPVDSLALIGSERLRFHLDARGKIDFLEAELSRTGASSDRFSPQAAWQSTFTRSDLEAKLRPLAGSIGELLDLRPARLGKSGRAVQIELVGSRRTVVVNGYRARGLLGLKDTLFTIQRVYGPNETVEKFVFDGRGWGHGVGLCQVGAYGMARAGRSYEEILKAYYLGTELHRAY